MAHWTSGPRYQACWQHRKSKGHRIWKLPVLPFAANLLKNPCAEIRSRAFLPLKRPSFTSIQNPVTPRLDPCQRNACLGSRCSCAMRAKEAPPRHSKGKALASSNVGGKAEELAGSGRRVRFLSLGGVCFWVGLGQHGCKGVSAATSWLLCRERELSQKGGVTAGGRHGSHGNPRRFRCGPLQAEGQVKGRPRWDGEREEEGRESPEPGFREDCDPTS